VVGEVRRVAEEDGVPGGSVKTRLDAIDRGSWPIDTTPGGRNAMRTWRLSTLAAGFTVVMTGPGFSAETVRVFRYDGGPQCGMGQAVPLDDMAKELTAVNIQVLSSEKRVVPATA
jgi:hypothetical protein